MPESPTQAIPIGHVEAGLRCFDRTVPEEINRILKYCLADYLFTRSLDGIENLTHEVLDLGMRAE